MQNNPNNAIVVSGLGVVSSIGNTVDSFWDSLLLGQSKISVLERPGRGENKFLGAELENFSPPTLLKKHKIRDASLSAQVAVEAIRQSWDQADLGSMKGEDIGLIVGGSNFTQREQRMLWLKYQDRPLFIRPSYARNFMDTDLCGICTQIFGIQGAAYTTGGASSSGQLAFIQAINLVATGQVKACLALGALMDLSELELQAFESLGAMVPLSTCEDPKKACRPFDLDHKGFVYGENCAVLVVETLASAQERKVLPLAKIAGVGLAMDANRETNPSKEGEIKAMQKALAQANWRAQSIDFVSPHGTGSKMGDEVELQAIQEAGLSHALINTTKSITGHGLSAAGAIELAVSVLQLQHQKLHPCLNLENPIEDFKWVQEKATHCECNRALSLSLGFGGINTAVCMEKLKF